MKYLFLSLIFLTSCSSILVKNYSIGDRFNADIWAADRDDYWFENREYREIIDPNKKLYIRTNRDLHLAKELEGQANFVPEKSNYALIVDAPKRFTQRYGGVWYVTDVLTKSQLEATLQGIEDTKQARIDAESRAQRERELAQAEERRKRQEAKRRKEEMERKKAEERRIAKEKERAQKRAAAAKLIKVYKKDRQNNNQHTKVINAIKFAIDGDNAKYHSESTPLEQQNYSYKDCVYSSWDKDNKLYQYDFNKIKWKSRDFEVTQNYVFTSVFHRYITYDCEGACRKDSNYLAALFSADGLSNIPVTNYSNMRFETEDASRTYKALREIERHCKGFETPY
jgi:hypothetical protein